MSTKTQSQSKSTSESKSEKLYTTKAILPKYVDQVAPTPTPSPSRSSTQLYLRPFHQDDLPAFNRLRTQIEVMKWTSKGVIDASLNETKDWMNRFLDPENKFNLPGGFVSSYAKKDEPQEPKTTDPDNSQPNADLEKTGSGQGQGPNSYAFTVCTDETNANVVGTMAVLNIHIEPAIGYMFFKEDWGKGYASLSARALLQGWYALEREVVQIPDDQVDRVEKIMRLAGREGALVGSEDKPLPEILYAVTEATNGASGRILEKLGFKVEKEYSVEERGLSVPLKNWFRLQDLDISYV